MGGKFILKKYTKHIGKQIVVLGAGIVVPTPTLITEPQPGQPVGDQTEQGMALQPSAFIKPAHAAGLAQVDMETENRKAKN